MSKTTKRYWAKGVILLRSIKGQKYNRMIPLLTLAILLSYTPAFAGIITVNVWESFPDTQGDNGFFAYRYAPTTGNYTLLNDAGAFGFNTPQTEWGAPGIYKYGSPYIAMWASGTRSNTGTPEDAVLAWAAPQSASYAVTGSWVSAVGSGSNGMDAYIKKNNTVLWSSYISPSATYAFSVTGLLEAGDKVYFGVNAHNDNPFSELNDGTYLYDAKIAYETISASVPEPGTVGLLGLGLAGLICLGRKRSSAA